MLLKAQGVSESEGKEEIGTQKPFGSIPGPAGGYLLFAPGGGRGHDHQNSSHHAFISASTMNPMNSTQKSDFSVTIIVPLEGADDHG